MGGFARDLGIIETADIRAELERQTTGESAVPAEHAEHVDLAASAAEAMVAKMGGKAHVHVWVNARDAQELDPKQESVAVTVTRIEFTLDQQAKLVALKQAATSAEIAELEAEEKRAAEEATARQARLAAARASAVKTSAYR